MSAVRRRSPAGSSALQAAVEPIRTTPITENSPASAQPSSAPLDHSTADEAAVSAPSETNPQPEVAAPATVQIPDALLDEKKPTTVNIRRRIKAQAETAVLRTGHYEDGYRSWNAFVEGALVHELERLAEKYNDGQPFPENTGPFRQGRPLGG